MIDGNSLPGSQVVSRSANRCRRGMLIPATLAAMNISLDRPWTTDMFLAWENRQEGKYEFDGRDVIPMTGGTVAHQIIVFNLLVALGRLLSGLSIRPLHEMRLRIGSRVRYPDVVVSSAPLDQTVRTL